MGLLRQKRGALLLFWLLSTVLLAAVPPERFVMETYPVTLSSNTVSIAFEAVGGVPEFVAIDIQRSNPMIKWRNDRQRALQNYRAELKTNKNARMPAPQIPLPYEPKWLPFRTNLLIDLGPEEGERQIMFAYRYKDQPFDGSWSGGKITVRGGTPTLRIVNPTNLLTSQSTIQLQGLTSRKFEKLRFDRFDQAGTQVASDRQGIGASYDGGYPFRYSDEYFTFTDVDLSPGTNTFVFHGTDEFGNEMSTNIVVVFSTAHDHTPPAIEIRWPKPDTKVSGDHYIIRGRLDDPDASLLAELQTQDGSMTREASPERNGVFLIDEIPLLLNTNRIALTARDAAGNISQTNFTIFGCEGPIITVDPIDPPDLWKKFIQVTGRVTPAAHDVWINGVQATVNPDGTWSATRVPTDAPSGGSAAFDLAAIPRSGASEPKAKLGNVLVGQASLSTNAIILNAASPACGVFQLHLSETMGKSFVVLASTNLVEWMPLLTNFNSGASFDYTVDPTNHVCRFFKVVPLP